MAEKSGKKYFIKRLNKPKYPESSNFSGDFRKQKIAECDAWLKRRKAVAAALPGLGSGNTIKPLEYFRDGPCFYEITNWVDISNIPYDEIWKEDKITRARMMMTIAMSLSDLHKVGIVHGDLDPGNILISRAASGNLVTKLIDFTDAFFEKDPPESIMSKEFWWSPEVALYSKAEEQVPNPYRERISCKSDVFSLGIIFHQYCSKGGAAPGGSKDQPWQEYTVPGCEPKIDPAIEPEFQQLIRSMLALEPQDRPSMSEIHKFLQNMVRGTPSNLVKSENKDKLKNDNSKAGSNAVSAGTGRKGNGASVVSAKLNERNVQKVELSFSDGTRQIMDLRLAKRQGFVQ